MRAVNDAEVDGMDERLQELLDYHAIQQLMIRYADRIDANDPAGSAACFAPDGIGVYWGEYRGRAAIAERLTGILRAFNHTSHHLTNLAVTFQGPDRATAQSYVYAFHRTRPNNDAMHYWGRWVDELVRIDGEWLFARREVVGIGRISAGNPPGDLLNHPGHPGRFPHAD
jgi:uncharacterized protein (TIGR02246 family)